MENIQKLGTHLILKPEGMVGFYQRMQDLEERRAKASEEATHLQQEIKVLNDTSEKEVKRLKSEYDTMKLETDKLRGPVVEVDRQFNELNARKESLLQSRK
eukprot:GGOE01022324.1.p1 GENE.GGOE01022324.1~~GGOE01022324.1.p1  ORF type:complete len:114 (+),score=8.55 GGOE01022324.1:40-342(+)